MTGGPADAAAAQRLVEARLGRESQDMLEAAVVLEAWGGVPAQRALDTARALMPRSLSPSRSSTGTLPAAGRQRGAVLEGAAFVLTVIAIAFWAAPLADGLGTAVVEHALTVALPLTLALQWGLRSRYLGRPKGLVELGRRRAMLLVCGCALVGLPAALFGLSGAVAGLLALTWTAGTVLIRRRWTAAYTAIVIAGTALMMAAIPPLAALGGIAAATTLTVVLALRPPAPSNRIAVGRWSRALGCGTLGAGIGILLVGDPSVTWTEGTVPALALLPSTIAGFWGGYHMWEIERVIPRAIQGMPAAAIDARAAAAPLRTLLGAACRLVGLATVLSAALLLFTPWLDATPTRAGVLVGFGLLALATLLVSLVEALGRGTWALLGVVGGLAAEAVVRVHGEPAFAGAALVAGAGLVVVLLLPAAIALLRHPARTLATALWIT